MKVADIVIGEEYVYEVSPGSRYGEALNERVRVLKIEKRTKRVYSGARHDFGGHESTQTLVLIESVDGVPVARNRDGWVQPQKIKGTWAELGPGIEAVEAARRVKERERTQERADAKEASEILTGLGYVVVSDPLSRNVAIRGTEALRLAHALAG